MLGRCMLCLLVLVELLPTRTLSLSRSREFFHHASNRATYTQVGTSAFAPAAVGARNDLLGWFQKENKRGTTIFYRQAYSVHGQRIQFHGSIFGVIQDAQANGCELKIKSGLYDRYSGNIGRKIIAETENRYTTSIVFTLTMKIADALEVVDARPVRQLAMGTAAECSSDQQCNLAWLKLKAAMPVIQMTDVTNDVADYDGEVKDFDGPVDQVYLPLSSREAGGELIAKMRAFAQTCAQ